jgi:Barstar (barnase inhibitor)
MNQPTPDLEDIESAGITSLAPEARESLLQAARSTDFNVCEIDLTAIEGENDLFAEFARALSLPDWFGHNWDALADCLMDLSWLEFSGYVLHIQGMDNLADTQPALHATLHEILLDSCLYWQDEGRAFWVFIELPAGT